MLYRALNVLVRLAEARVPQLTSVILGLVGAGTGLLFLTRANQFSASAVLAPVVAFAPAMVWGVLFLISGVCLVNTALLNARKAYWYCLLLGRLMFTFFLLSGLGLFGGAGIGLVSLYTFGFGLLCDLNGIAALSPWLRKVITRHDETVGVKVS
jgi:hypothetical protein